ncbi:MAG: aminoacetone oxidase family FAD-binding enzyme [Gammaproteobacteria bacterium]|nr:MAG: aminoacetone oxidase family FAD-binding enzyme [Gammaproteobacteria bacterium]
MKNNDSKKYDVVIIGAGAAGLMCAIRAGERGLSVLIMDKAERVGKKILISGGGRCNFTNLHIEPSAYLSPNPHFCKSALSRYTQWHFIELLEKHGLSYREKTLGQLFCQQKSAAIVQMLIDEVSRHRVDIALNESIIGVDRHNATYQIDSETQRVSSKQLVVACGGPSFPKLGSTDFALQIAKQFGIKKTPFSPALVPLTLPPAMLEKCRPLAGVSHRVHITCREMAFTENLLFTHRGLSGPVILQISSYWQKGDSLRIDLCPDIDLYNELIKAKKTTPQRLLSQFLSGYMPKKLAAMLTQWYFNDGTLQQLSNKQLADVTKQLQHWQITPSGSEGMKKAEVSRGGVHPDSLSGKTFACRQQAGLYFIGEAVDVIGWLGGYNFQWAWSSGWCCGDSLQRYNKITG